MVLVAAGVVPVAGDFGKLPRRVAGLHLCRGRWAVCLSMQTPFLALRNTLLLAFGATTLAVLYGSIIAYGVSRYRLLSEVRMFQLLMLRMVPPIVIVAPCRSTTRISAYSIRCSASACSISSAACPTRYG